MRCSRSPSHGPMMCRTLCSLIAFRESKRQAHAAECHQHDQRAALACCATMATLDRGFLRLDIRFASPLLGWDGCFLIPQPKQTWPLCYHDGPCNVHQGWLHQNAPTRRAPQELGHHGGRRHGLPCEFQRSVSLRRCLRFIRLGREPPAGDERDDYGSEPSKCCERNSLCVHLVFDFGAAEDWQVTLFLS